MQARPSKTELRAFGALLAVFFGIVGGLALWQFESVAAARVLWAVGLGLGISYYLLPPIRLPLYLAWMRAVAPIGWAVSHLVLAAVFFLIITPIATAMRLFRRDKLERRFDESLETYWVEHDPGSDAARYLHQS
jgi:hypothetical protein